MHELEWGKPASGPTIKIRASWILSTSATTHPQHYVERCVERTCTDMVMASYFRLPFWDSLRGNEETHDKMKSEQSVASFQSKLWLCTSYKQCALSLIFTTKNGNSSFTEGMQFHMTWGLWMTIWDSKRSWHKTTSGTIAVYMERTEQIHNWNSIQWPPHFITSVAFLLTYLETERIIMKCFLTFRELCRTHTE